MVQTGLSTEDHERTQEMNAPYMIQCVCVCKTTAHGLSKMEKVHPSFIAQQIPPSIYYIYSTGPVRIPQGLDIRTGLTTTT